MISSYFGWVAAFMSSSVCQTQTLCVTCRITARQLQRARLRLRSPAPAPPGRRSHDAQLPLQIAPESRRSVAMLISGAWCRRAPQLPARRYSGRQSHAIPAPPIALFRKRTETLHQASIRQLASSVRRHQSLAFACLHLATPLPPSSQQPAYARVPLR